MNRVKEHLTEALPAFRTKTLELDSLQFNWEAIFTTMPKLKRLNLAKVPLLSLHLPEILKAAARCCRHVEFLIMPNQNDAFSVVHDYQSNRIMAALREHSRRGICMEVAEGWCSF
ncbi:unnamed protein product [Phytophthora lilii]|uniref:Unnamed protein product n=1 Tax=Phytophthora lilii TaxID=2077276 RepID=A0A9W7CYZ6_9STRA|nr:unnamed protein product [Phytophthora lilii]